MPNCEGLLFLCMVISGGSLLTYGRFFSFSGRTLNPKTYQHFARRKIYYGIEIEVELFLILKWNGPSLHVTGK